MNFFYKSFVFFLLLFSTVACNENKVDGVYFGQIDRYEYILCHESVKKVKIHKAVSVILDFPVGMIKKVQKVVLSDVDKVDELYFDREKSGRQYYYYKNLFGKEKHYESFSLNDDRIDLIWYVPIFPKLLNVKLLMVDDKEYHFNLLKYNKPLPKLVEYDASLINNDNSYVVKIKDSNVKKYVLELIKEVITKDGTHKFTKIPLSNQETELKINFDKDVKYLAFQLINDNGHVAENKIEFIKQCKK